MPLKLNLGLNKKVADANYGSRGASVNVELELESALISEPGKLQDRIRQLFNTVRSSLAEELDGTGSANGSGNRDGQGKNGTSPSNGAGRHTSDPPASNGGTSHSNQSNQSSRGPRPATTAQVKAIIAIARKHQVDLQRVLQNRFHLARPEDLSIKQASELIDTLKSSSGG
jgi:hypothetical protein